MNKSFLLAILFIVLYSCKSQLGLDINDDTSLTQVIETYEKMDDVINKKYPSRWPNFEPKKLKLQQETLTQIQKRLKAISPSELNDQENINRDLLLFKIDNRLQNLYYETHLFPLNSEGGFITSVVHRLSNFPIKDSKGFQSYQTQLKTLPAYFDERIEAMKEGQSKGKSSPKVVVQNCITLIEVLLATAVEQQFFFTPVQQKDDQKAVVRELVENKVLPAYKKLHKYLKEEYLPNAPAEIGISSITDGKAFYEQRVQHFTSFDINPQEVFEVGQQEVKRLRAEMQTIIDELGFEGSYAEFLAFLRTDEQFYPKTAEELLQYASDITEEMQSKLPTYFNNLPKVPLVVRPVPAAIAPTYTVGRYSRGSIKEERAGEYWVNTYNLSQRAMYIMPALSLHEGVPGHHLQIMLNAEMTDIPNFRKNSYISAFGEGWGLYAEYLGQEAGMYKTQYEKFGRLAYEMWRACRLVVDPGMHYMGWTREEALNFMATNTSLPIHEVTTEIDRYIGWPGQAVSYKMGELKIKELRLKAEKELGDKFDIRAFHDKVLENGSVPLATLERVINTYIKENK